MSRGIEARDKAAYTLEQYYSYPDKVSTKNVIDAIIEAVYMAEVVLRIDGSVDINGKNLDIPERSLVLLNRVKEGQGGLAPEGKLKQPGAQAIQRSQRISEFGESERGQVGEKANAAREAIGDNPEDIAKLVDADYYSIDKSGRYTYYKDNKILFDLPSNAIVYKKEGDNKYRAYTYISSITYV